MQTRISDKKRRVLHSSRTKVMMNLFFIVVFSLNLFLQPLQAFSLANKVSNKEKSTSLTNLNHFPSSTYSLLASVEPNFSLFDMEMSEDEENETDGNELYFSRFQHFYDQELAFTCILQSRLLQLLTSRQKKTEIDFFILYHSWKKHLS
jgi:hypothetical protein